MLELEQYLEGLVHRVCADLANIYPRVGPASTHGLIFPTKRDGSLRISEQEAELLFFQYLTLDRKFFFSVETPTVETYRQKGMTPMSARVDLTLYDSHRKPVAHLECKSHNCGLEDIRKDLEKLLREKRTGCWFHTLENANRNTIPVLLAKFTRAFSLLPEWVAANQCSYLFAFFAVKPARLLYQWVRFSGDASLNASTLSAAFCTEDMQAWKTVAFRDAQPIDTTVRGATTITSSAGKGSREAFLVYAPKLAAETFLHLSIRGGSYRIRRYDLDMPGSRPKSQLVPGCPTFDSLRQSDVIERYIPLTAEDMMHNLDEEPEYWCERIRTLNSRYLRTEAASIGCNGSP